MICGVRDHMRGRHPSRYFHDQCSVGGKSIATLRVNLFLTLINPEYEPGLPARTVFQVPIDSTGTPTSLPALVACAQPGIRHSRQFKVMLGR